MTQSKVSIRDFSIANGLDIFKFVLIILMLKSAQASFRQNMSGIKALHHWSMLEIAAVKLESNVNSTHVCMYDHVI